MPGALLLMGFVSEEGVVHERREQLSRWGLFRGITLEAAFLCFVQTKQHVEPFC